MLEFGGNDCDFIWDDIAREPSVDDTPKTPLNVFEDILNSMIDFILKKGKKPVLTTLPPLYADNYFNWFTNNDKEKGINILKWLKDVWRIYWWQERYSNCVQHIAGEKGVDCIDIRREFLKGREFSHIFVFGRDTSQRSGAQAYIRGCAGLYKGIRILSSSFAFA